MNEFLSYSRPTPVGGEYVMPSEVAMAALEEIYGEGPDLQNIDLEESGARRTGEWARRTNRWVTRAGVGPKAKRT